MSDGYIYFIRCRELVKIGHSFHPELRIYDLSIHIPFKLELIAQFEAPRPWEKLVHRYMKPALVHREWYRFNKRARTLIETGKFDYVENPAEARKLNPKPNTVDLINKTIK